MHGQTHIKLSFLERYGAVPIARWYFMAPKFEPVDNYFYLEGLSRSADRSLCILCVRPIIYSVIYIMPNLF